MRGSAVGLPGWSRGYTEKMLVQSREPRDAKNASSGAPWPVCGDGSGGLAAQGDVKNRTRTEAMHHCVPSSSLESRRVCHFACGQCAEGGEPSSSDVNERRRSLEGPLSSSRLLTAGSSAEPGTVEEARHWPGRIAVLGSPLDPVVGPDEPFRAEEAGR